MVYTAFMKTTLELDDRLDAQVRKAAHRHGWTLKETVSRALRAGLGLLEPRQPAKEFRWHTVQGPLLVDPSDREALSEAMGPPEL